MTLRIFFGRTSYQKIVSNDFLRFFGRTRFLEKLELLDWVKTNLIAHWFKSNGTA
jgi:hypothetical protein